MKFSLPSFLNYDIYQKSKKINRPFFCILIVIGFVIRALQYGKYNGQYDILYSLYGAFLLEIVLFGSFFLMQGRSFSQLGRFQILYMAFVPNITYMYLKRIMDFRVAFELREDVVKHKWPAAIALWYPDILDLFQLLVPFIILLIMAIQMNRSKIKKPYEKWYVRVCIIGAVLLLVTLPFANLMNLFIYVARMLLVCVLWHMWETMRTNKSLEPMAMVSWAEILLFFVLWLKGVVESFGILS